MENEILHFSVAKIYTPTFLARKLNFTQLHDISICNAMRRLDCHVSLFIVELSEDLLKATWISGLIQTRHTYTLYYTRDRRNKLGNVS